MSFKSTTLGRSVNLPDLIDLSGPELRNLYNEITGKSVGKFSTRAIGIARVKKVMSKKPSSAKDPKRRVQFDSPFTGKVRKYRHGTKREKLINALAGGATFEECQTATGWPYKVCFENIQLLHTYVGFGLTENGDGVIKLVYA